MNKIPGLNIGVFGGSGLYEFFDKEFEVMLNTPYGKPSDKITIGKYKNKLIAFLPRHGRNHTYPPQSIPYAANLYALKKIGVERIIAPCASGSLKPSIKPGHFVICDQFLNFTSGRLDSFFQGEKSKARFNQGKVVHISTANPYCEELRNTVLNSCKQLKIKYRPKGCVVVINGPRFSTKAESKMFRQLGADVINMTQYPEVVLAGELGLCYVTISLVTDYDSGCRDNLKIRPVTTEQVFKIFKRNNEKINDLLKSIIVNIPENRKCDCALSLKNAVVS